VCVTYLRLPQRPSLPSRGDGRREQRNCAVLPLGHLLGDVGWQWWGTHRSEMLWGMGCVLRDSG